ncbi:MAG: TonB family protein [Undibacterium sp.]|nr:TonB family protein [Opitutaceae bacterium]
MNSKIGLRRLFWSLLLIAAGRAQAPVPPFDNSLVDGPVLVNSWGAPVYPADALREKIGGRTVIRLIVDERGAITAARVLKADDPRLGEAALAAVKTWKFSAAVDNEKKIVSCVDVPLNFNAEKGQKNWPSSYMTNMANHPRAAPVTGAEPKSTPSGEYPGVLSERRLAGAVEFSCRVDAAGRASAPRILGTTHADFVLPALAALAKWEFTPAKQGDLVIATELVGEVSFDAIAGNRAEVLAANGIAAPEGGAPGAWPQLVRAADAVWPHDLLMQGGSGEAVLEFTVEANGSVASLRVLSATQPAFGQAALAALATWRFRPALSNGQTIAVPLIKRVEFVAVPQSAAAAEAIKDPVAELVRAVRAGSIGAPKGLDEKLTPIFRVPPVYPAALKAAGGPKGEAVIEFVIARDGRARLPKIVSASHEEFGWAAATAVAQWVFKAPMREGQAVDVKVSIPVGFAPPES